MLGFKRYYHSLIRKYVILVGSLFDDVWIERTSPSGETLSVEKVPVSYAVKEKMLSRLKKDPDASLPIQSLLPNVTFELVSLRYDGKRALPLRNMVARTATDPSNLRYVYDPVPYDLGFQVHVYVKNVLDGNKIIEQILPFFKPEWVVSMELIPEMDVVRDVPIVLNSITPNDLYTDDFRERTVFMWTLDLTVKGYLYGPVREKPMIKIVDERFHTGAIDDESYVQIEVSPGQTSNGVPTSSASETVPPRTIRIDTDYGYVVTREDHEL